jgi:hypothetical protein
MRPAKWSTVEMKLINAMFMRHFLELTLWPVATAPGSDTDEVDQQPEGTTR